MVVSRIATASEIDPDVLGHLDDLLSIAEEASSKDEFSLLREPVLTDTGVLMGDPGTKGVLTLLNLIAEEEAALLEKLDKETLTVQDLMDPNPVQFPWRHFSCAGDDHTAIGPDRYLDAIGKAHERNHMVLSEGKHVRSKTGGFYCERVFFKGDSTVMTERVDYSRDVLVDSVKVRLLSPETKDREAEVETNPAIGKAKLLFKQLTWSPPGWERTLGVIVQRRFMGRFRRYLPMQPNGDFNRQIELPIALGGLGLSPPFFREWDLENVLAQLSENHLRILHHVLRGGEIDTMAKRTLSHYASDRYARGVRLDEAVDQIIDRLFDIHWTVPEVRALNIARTKFKLRESIGYRTVLKHIGKLGYETKFTLKRKLARSWNQALLMAEPPRRGFMSATWGERQLSFEADLQIALVTNEISEEYDLKFIYDEIKKYKNSDALIKSIRSRELYLDPTYEMELDGVSHSVLKDLRESIPDTKLPPMGGFV